MYRHTSQEKRKYPFTYTKTNAMHVFQWKFGLFPWKCALDVNQVRSYLLQYCEQCTRILTFLHEEFLRKNTMVMNHANSSFKVCKQTVNIMHDSYSFSFIVVSHINHSVLCSLLNLCFTGVPARLSHYSRNPKISSKTYSAIFHYK